MEEYLKIQRVEYLNIHLLDHTQILNLSLDDQKIFYKSLKGRRPPMEDNLKISKVEYPSNHLLDHTPIINLSLDDQTIFYKSSEVDLRCKGDLKECRMWVLSSCEKL